MNPIVFDIGAVVVGFGIAAYILRWEIRFQTRRHRYGGYIGGDR